jgi:hypothetical protein
MPFRDVYAALSLPYPHSLQSHEDFLATLNAVSPRVHELGARILPALFEASPDMPVFLRSYTWRWDTLAQHLRGFGTTGLLVRLPLLWQCEPLIHHACRESGTFFFLNDAANMPVGRIALCTAALDTVLTTADDAERFAEHLHATQEVLPHWIVIHAITHSPRVPVGLDPSRVAHEVHLCPGVPLYVQCDSQRGISPLRFHLADGFSDSPDGICGTAHDSIPLVKYLPPHQYRPAGTCACGSPLFAPPV